MHDVRIGLAEPEGHGSNAVAGTVARQIYLGAHRDYLVALPGDIEVRVTAPMHVEAPVGSRVWLTFPPEQCRALAH
jgi:iron(III) transport system ATP-binding protein